MPAGDPIRPIFITGGVKLGGSTTFLLNLCGEFVQQGVDHLVLSLEHEHPMLADFEAAGVNFDRIDSRPRIIEDTLAWAVDRSRAFQPTHAVACLGNTSFEILRYIPPGIPRFGMVQSDDPAVYRALSVYGDVMDAIVGVSNRICEVLRETPALAHLPAHPQPYGIPVPEQFTARGTDAGEKSSPLRILYLGRLGKEQKRVQLFPRIYEQLCESGRPFAWTIAGDGPDAAWLRNALPPRGGLQGVRYTGAVAYGEVPALLDSHDIFLLASDYEGLPLSLLEAMAHGLVPVVSDLPSGIREVVDGGTGLLVPPDAPNEYARAILVLEADRPLLAQLSRQARERVRSGFSTTTMCGRWLQMFRGTVCLKEPEWRRARIECPRPLAGRPLFHPLLRLARRFAKRFLAPHL